MDEFEQWFKEFDPYKIDPYAFSEEEITEFSIKGFLELAFNAGFKHGMRYGRERDYEI